MICFMTRHETLKTKFKFLFRGRELHKIPLVEHNGIPVKLGGLYVMPYARIRIHRIEDGIEYFEEMNDFGNNPPPREILALLLGLWEANDSGRKVFYIKYLFNSRIHLSVFEEALFWIMPFREKQNVGEDD